MVHPDRASRRRAGLDRGVSPQGEEVARGLVNYSAAETQKIIGHPTTDIEELLGYIDGPELIHRDNLILV